MAFVHGLVKTEVGGRRGWITPVELGEAAPHYVSFVIPQNAKHGFFNVYTCETVSANEGRRERMSHELSRKGHDSFLMRINDRDLWFVVRSGSKDDAKLPYIGTLTHHDFQSKLTEIEPETPEILDRLFEENGVIVVGCDPFIHYAGISSLERTG